LNVGIRLARTTVYHEGSKETKGTKPFVYKMVFAIFVLFVSS